MVSRIIQYRSFPAGFSLVNVLEFSLLNVLHGQGIPPTSNRIPRSAKPLVGHFNNPKMLTNGICKNNNSLSSVNSMDENSIVGCPSSSRTRPPLLVYDSRTQSIVTKAKPGYFQFYHAVSHGISWIGGGKDRSTCESDINYVTDLILVTSTLYLEFNCLPTQKASHMTEGRIPVIKLLHPPTTVIIPPRLTLICLVSNPLNYISSIFFPSPTLQCTREPWNSNLIFLPHRPQHSQQQLFLVDVVQENFVPDASGFRDVTSMSLSR